MLGAESCPSRMDRKIHWRVQTQSECCLLMRQSSETKVETRSLNRNHVLYRSPKTSSSRQVKQSSGGCGRHCQDEATRGNGRPVIETEPPNFARFKFKSLNVRI